MTTDYYLYEGESIDILRTLGPIALQQRHEIKTIDKKFNEHNIPDHVIALIYNNECWNILDETVEYILNCFVGKFDNWEEFARYSYYVDWEKMGEDLKHDFFEYRGYFFSRS